MRSDHGPVGDGRTGLRHLVQLGQRAVRTLAVHVHGHDAELVGGAWRRERKVSQWFQTLPKIKVFKDLIIAFVKHSQYSCSHSFALPLNQKLLID